MLHTTRIGTDSKQRPSRDTADVSRFVCEVRAEDTSAPTVIRLYRSRRPDNLIDKIKMWEAARATLAASTFFDPVEIEIRQSLSLCLQEGF